MRHRPYLPTTSLTLKFLAVVPTSEGKIGQSFVPALVDFNRRDDVCFHAAHKMSLYPNRVDCLDDVVFTSNHRTNREVVNPVASTANSVSTAFNGRAR